MIPLLEPLVTSLLKLCSSSKKLVSTTVSSTLQTMLENITEWRNWPILTHIITYSRDKSANVRACVMSLLVSFLQPCSSTTPTLESAHVERDRVHCLESLDTHLVKSVCDSVPNVRKNAREALFYLSTCWPDYSNRFVLYHLLVFTHSM